MSNPNKKLRILIATGLYPPEIGGPATYSKLLESELPKYGHSVQVLPFSLSRSLPKIIRHFHYFFLVWKAALQSDVIFAQDVASAGLPALVAARLSGTKFFVRVPGDYAWEQSTQRFGVTETIDEFQVKKYGFRVESLRMIQKIVTKFADRVVTPSNYFKKLVSGWGVSEERISTIYNGVNLDIESIKPELPKVPTIVSAGRLVPWKGFDTLIKILEKLPEWQLVILGDGPEHQKLLNLAQKLNVSDRVLFTGQVAREEVQGWYEVADVFVLNTSFESFSFQIVEALASGVPVITTNVGSLPELIENKVHGVLLSPDDEEALISNIASVLTDSEKWQKRTRAAVEKSKVFSIKNTTQQVNKLFLDKV